MSPRDSADASSRRMQELLPASRSPMVDHRPAAMPKGVLKMSCSTTRQGTALVLQSFESAEDMEAGAKVFSAMDPSDAAAPRAFRFSTCAIGLYCERR